MAYTTIDNPELYFQVKAYTGNGTAIGSGGLAVTLDGDEDMQPDFVWLKNRSTADRSNQVYDVVRGVTKGLKTNSTDEENTSSERLTAFGSDGFTVGDNVDVNTSGDNYVAWCWKESATAGFDIISYTGDGSDRDLSHSLSASPEFIIIKQRSGTQDWSTQSTALGLANYLILNGNNASAGTSGALVDAVSSSTISVDDNAYVNENTSTYIGYLWRSVQGYSKFGSYTGNGNADGPFIYTGFRPAIVIIKRTSDTEYWGTLDNKRNPYNPANLYLAPNRSDADTTYTTLDFTANGFKHRSTGAMFNASGSTYVYMCFAEAPVVNSNGVPCNAR